MLKTRIPLALLTCAPLLPACAAAGLSLDQDPASSSSSSSSSDLAADPGVQTMVTKYKWISTDVAAKGTAASNKDLDYGIRDAKECIEAGERETRDQARKPTYDINTAKVDTAKGPKTVPELLAACRELLATFEQTKKEKRSAAGAKTPSFTFFASQAPWGEPKTSFSCGDPIYANLRAEGYNADGFDVEWHLDGKPMGKAGSSIVVSKDQGHRPSFTMIPEENSKDYSPDTFTFLKPLSKLTPGTHELVLELVDRRGANPPVKTYPGATLTLSLACPSGADKYGKLYEKRRATRLSMADWLPDRGTPEREAIERADARYHDVIASVAPKVVGPSAKLVKFLVTDAKVEEKSGAIQGRTLYFQVGIRLPDQSCAVLFYSAHQPYVAARNNFEGEFSGRLLQESEILCSKLNQ
jgi:hypothetical protein